MNFPDALIETMKDTLQKTHRVQISIFDDKVKDCGTITVEKGLITIKLDYLPSLTSDEAMADFLSNSVAIATRLCYYEDPKAFDPHDL